MIFVSIAYRRNGISGAPYYLVRFRDPAVAPGALLTATIFDKQRHIAVFSDTGDGFRAETFEDALRSFIASEAGQLMAFPNIATTRETDNGARV